MTELRRVHLNNKSWRDQRGWGLTPLEAAGLPVGATVGDLHAVSLKPGAVRGNHLHPDSTEWFLLCGGPAEIAWQEGDQPTRQETVQPDDIPALYEVPPGIAHAIRNLSNQEIILLAFSNALTRETVRCPTSLFEEE
jgi:oxalate decarboxylase/phosphoglucose isomerase-like protein (cupin superfamily)